jgi:integrase
MGRDVWEIRYIAGQDVLTGKPLRRSETFHGGYREALKRRSELISEVQKGQGGGLRSTVGALLDAWLARNEERNANGDLADNTLASYRYQVKRLKEFAPAFLALRLDRLESAEPVEDLLRALRLAGVTPAGVVQTHKAIRAAFEWGIGRRWLKWNPAKYLDDNPSPPKKSTPKITVDQVKLLVETAPQVHPDFPAYFLVAALTGLRRQALCGLMWSDIDWKNQMLTINRVRNQVWGKTVEVEWAKHGRGKPKPQNWLDPVAVDTLTALQNAQLRRCHDSGTTPPADGWVFSLDGLGLQPMSGDYVQRRVKRIAELAGLPHRSHDLRHHRATELVAAGVDVARVAQELDHQDKSFTLRTYVGARPVGEGPMASLGQQYLPDTKRDKAPRRRRSRSA